MKTVVCVARMREGDVMPPVGLTNNMKVCQCQLNLKVDS